MYAVRFLGADETGAHIEIGVSCQHYSINNNNNGLITVTTFAFMSDVIGATWYICLPDMKAEKAKALNSSNNFDVCHIENERGRTVKVIGQRK